MKKTIGMVFILMTLAATLIPISAQASENSTFVGMYGIVTSYSGEPAYGMIGAIAEIDKWAEVGVFWVPGIATILSLPANYSFYAARLVSTETVKLDYLGWAFYVSGLWDVYNITLVYDAHGEIIDIIIEYLVKNEFGELKVTEEFEVWRNFTVEIEHIMPIAGIVRRYCIMPEEISRLDMNLDGTVDIFDLVHVARRHGSKPGIGIPSYDFHFGFDFYSDLNSDYTIDIDDLIIIAKAS